MSQTCQKKIGLKKEDETMSLLLTSHERGSLLWVGVFREVNEVELQFELQISIQE